MTILTFDPSVPPSPGTKDTPEFKIKTAGFGDGYTQEAPDGINNARHVIALQWVVLVPDQAAEIFDFLFARRQNAEPFLFTRANDTQRQWKCTALDRTLDTPNQVTATFREDFSILS